MHMLEIKINNHRYKVTWNKSLSSSDDRVYINSAISRTKNFIIVVIVKKIALASMC